MGEGGERGRGREEYRKARGGEEGGGERGRRRGGGRDSVRKEEEGEEGGELNYIWFSENRTLEVINVWNQRRLSFQFSLLVLHD